MRVDHLRGESGALSMVSALPSSGSHCTVGGDFIDRTALNSPPTLDVWGALLTLIQVVGEHPVGDPVGDPVRCADLKLVLVDWIAVIRDPREDR